MRRSKINWPSIILLSMILTPSVHASENTAPVSAKQLLLDQLRLGEATYRDDLVEQSLHRLELIDPNDPQVIAAQLRLALRQNNQVLADKQLEKLKRLAPDSAIYQQAQMDMAIKQPNARLQLQQARALAKGDRPEHLVAAKKIYDELFHGQQPPPDLALEYWMLVARLPGQQQVAYQHLNDLHQSLWPGQTLKDDNGLPKIQDSVKSTLSRLNVSAGNQALKANNIALAQQKYQQAYQLNDTNTSALVGFGDVALARKDDKTALAYYQKALQIDPTSISAIYGIVNIYKRQSPQKAINYLNTLSPDLQVKMQDAKQNLQGTILEQQAEQLIAQKRWAEALAIYHQAQQIDPKNVWLTYRLATALYQAGQPEQADTLFQQSAAAQNQNPQYTYTYILYLLKTDRKQEAFAQFDNLARDKWDTDLQALWERLHRDARLEEIETLIASGKFSQARQRLEAEQQSSNAKDINTQRRLANAWSAVGEPQKAAAIFQQLKSLISKQAPNEDSALVLRDAARNEQTLHQPQQAQEDYRQAMVFSGITSVLPADNETYTYLTRYHEDDDWMKSSIRSDAADLYRQQDTRFTLDHDYWRSTGTGGTSNLIANDTMLQADQPFLNGREFFRTDIIQMTAGDFVTNNGHYDKNFGTCDINACSTDVSQRANGASLATGWHDDHWAMDVGTTPIGFDVVNLVGGLSYSNDFQHIGWTLTASRRPFSNSLLSFAGTKDPNTGTTWGGIVANGITLSGSYDRGGSNGFWTNLNGATLTGDNVPTNQRLIFMAGYYYKFINETNRRFSMGLNNMQWHYDKDLSGYALGRGGYYSPQKYFSLGVPIDFRQRFDNWSYDVGGSVSWSRATVQSSHLYPIPSLIPNLSSSDNSLQSGSTSTGFGYTIVSSVEHRLTSHWISGIGVDIQRANDYTPSHGLLYLRYSVDGWNGDLDMPPRPLVPYAEFR